MLPEYLITNVSASDYLKEFFEQHSFSKVGLVVDENTEALCLPLVKEALGHALVFRINSGEKYKTLETCQYLWDRMTEEGFDRYSLLVNLGGGVIGDMGGFCASTFKRGISFINIPTTLLSQVDASIGGKLGIDYGSFKNHIGVFKDPYRVIIDERFLNTLPETELLSGYAEVLKHGLIADRAHWDQLITRHLTELRWKNIVKHSIEIKSRVVMEDPYETGLRKILNFGHTLGHAVESYFLENSQPILHGEAIAMGMIMESWLSVQLCNFPTESLRQIQDYILKVYGHHPIGADKYQDIFERTLQDKKNQGKKILAVLLKEIAEPEEKEIGEEEIKKAIEYYDNILEDV